MASSAPGPPSLVRLNGIPIQNLTMEEALDRLEGLIERGERRCVFFANAHCLNVSVSDPAYRELLLREDAIVFGDGAGVRIAGRVTKQPVRDNVNGTDMFPLLCARAAERGRSLFLLGARPEIPDTVARNMTERFPGLQIAGVQHGYFDASETDRVVDEINASQADVVLVGFGVPRQEYWIAAQRERLTAPVVMGVGGLFDYYSGRIPRAPRVVRATSMEWLWRLAMEPKRMWRRYLVGNLVFMGRVARWRLRGPEPDAGD